MSVAAVFSAALSLAVASLGWALHLQSVGELQVASPRAIETMASARPDREDRFQIEATFRTPKSTPPVLAELVDRPLFSPTRRPRAQEVEQKAAAEPEKPAPDQNLMQSHRLVATVWNGKRRIGLLRPPRSGEAVQITMDAEVNGWRVSELDVDQVTLTSAGRKVTISIGM